MRSPKKMLEKIDRLKDELDKKGRILSSVYRISHLLNQPANRDKILQAILNESQKIFGFTRGVILSLNKADETLETQYCIGFTAAEVKHAFSHPIHVKTQICRETIAVRTGRTNYTRDVRNDSHLTEIDKKMEKIWRRVSAITVPLKINREVIGVIEGDSIEEELVLSKNDIKLFTAFANQASIILENARLYEQVLAERNIAENILESAPNGILTMDRHKKIQSVNRKAEEILKLKRRRVIGKLISGTLREDLVVMLNDAVDHERNGKYAEIANSKTGGAAEVYGVNLSPLEDYTGTAAGAIMTIQDLTEIKKTEAMLRRVEKLSSLGQMSASIAHEIRNPLASINFDVQLLSKRLSQDPSMQIILNNTLEGVNRIKMVIKRTLDYSKNISPSMSYGNVHDVLAEAVDLVRQHLMKNRIEIKDDLMDNVPGILFDPHQIRNVFVNLLQNALEAMPGGGAIAIKSRIEDNHTIDGSKWFLMTIRDSGTGIPQENLKKIFDPFFTTKPEGSGLGLSIVHKILENHKALIEVESRWKRGTSFHLRFPLHEETDRQAGISLDAS